MSCNYDDNFIQKNQYRYPRQKCNRNLLKYCHKNKVLYFPSTTITNVNKLQIDYDSYSYITLPSDAKIITEIIMKYMDKIPCPDNNNFDDWDSLESCEKMKKINHNRNDRWRWRKCSQFRSAF